MTRRQGRQGERGIALLMVLWVVALLMVTVFSFTALSRTETVSAAAYRDLVTRRSLAEGGIQRALMEIVYRRQLTQDLLEEPWQIDGTPYRMTLENGTVSVRIIEEAGKLDINMLTDASGILLKNLLMQRGIAEEQADTVVDSLLDWKDSGDSDAHRLHGAETDYYASLPVPYAAKNANFDTVEELLLVKGMTPEILYGTRDRQGIAPLLTVHSRKDRININAAPRDLLAALPGMTPELADAVVAERALKKRLSLADLRTVLGEAYAAAAPFVAVMESQAYTIEAAGFGDREQAAYGIRATITFADADRYRYLYYKSPATVAP